MIARLLYAARSPSEEGPGWLLTLVDLLSLLLAFFIMIFAMSEPEPARWREMSTALAARLNPDAVRQPEPRDAPLSAEAPASRPGQHLDYLAALLGEKLKAAGPLRDAAIHRLGDRLVISLPSDLLFRSGSADLQPGSRAAIAVVAEALLTVSNRVEVVGHSDPAPIATPAFPSNWELSLARALAVAQALSDGAYDRPLAVAGAAETRFGDLDARLTRDQRFALARRVDVVVLPDRGPS